MSGNLSWLVQFIDLAWFNHNFEFSYEKNPCLTVKTWNEGALEAFRHTPGYSQSMSSPSNLCFFKKATTLSTKTCRLVADSVMVENFSLPSFQPPMAKVTFRCWWWIFRSVTPRKLPRPESYKLNAEKDLPRWFNIPSAWRTATWANSIRYQLLQR